jgi:hypothetical protein
MSGLSGVLDKAGWLLLRCPRERKFNPTGEQ